MHIPIVQMGHWGPERDNDLSRVTQPGGAEQTGAGPLVSEQLRTLPGQRGAPGQPSGSLCEQALLPQGLFFTRSWGSRLHGGTASQTEGDGESHASGQAQTLQALPESAWESREDAHPPAEGGTGREGPDSPGVSRGGRTCLPGESRAEAEEERLTASGEPGPAS